VFTGSGSLLLHPSEPIESRNEAEAISGPQTVKAVAAGTRFKRLQLARCQAARCRESWVRRGNRGWQVGSRSGPGLLERRGEKLCEAAAGAQRCAGLGIAR
jgi:hypothetical protein